MALEATIWRNFSKLAEAEKQLTNRSAQRIGIDSGTGPDIFRQFLAAEGRRNIYFSNAIRIAEHLGVTIESLTDPTFDPLLLPRYANQNFGFSESDASLWSPEEEIIQKQIHDLILSLGSRAKTPASYRISRSLPGFEFKSGDVVVVDLAGGHKEGELVVSREVDFETGASETYVRRYTPPFLMPDQSTERPLVIEDGGSVSIVGPIISAFRISV